MKILLLQPPIQDFYNTEIRLQPVGLCSLKASLKNQCSDVQVIVKDYHAGWGRKTIPIPSRLKYLQEYYPTGDKSPFAVFGPYYHFGASFRELAEEVAAEKPDLVGISCLFTAYSQEALRCADEIKKLTDAKIVLGGSHVSAVPEDVLDSPSVDFVICGEGEKALVELVRAIKEEMDLRQVPGLGYKSGGRFVFNSPCEPYDFRTLPQPDFEDFPIDRYLYEGKPMCVILTSRGCPFHCKFCSVHTTFGNGFTQRSPEDVFSEIRFRAGQGYQVFDFEDDNLTHDRRFIMQLCSLLIDEFHGNSIQLLAMNGVSYWNLDREILLLMKNAGFSHLNVSLVSSNSRVLHVLNRPHDDHQFIEVVRHAHQLDLRIVSYQILGLPHEELDSMIQTVALQAGLPVLIGASPYYWTPGCSLPAAFSATLPRQEFMTARLTAMGQNNVYFDRDDIYTLFVTIRIINFLKGLRITGPKIDLRAALETAKKGDKRSTLGADLLSRLLEEGVLYSSGKKGLKKCGSFKINLFKSVWEKLACIVTQGGNCIEIDRREKLYHAL